MAAATYHGFLERFEAFAEFQEVAQATIERALEAASIKLNVSNWGDQWAEGVLQRAAHEVCMVERVTCCKLITEERTPFLAEYERMRGAIISGDRVW